MSSAAHKSSLPAPILIANARKRGRGTGIMFLAFFGSWWLALGVNILGAPAVAYALIALGGIALFLSGLSQSRRAAGAPAEPDAARARAFHRINAAQWIAIIATIGALNLAHRPEWITPAIMLIVGLHFFPLARLFRSREHAVIGAALCAVSLIYPIVARDGAADGAGPLAAGLILWTAALRWALRSR